jgi:hypothetical protein
MHNLKDIYGHTPTVYFSNLVQEQIRRAFPKLCFIYASGSHQKIRVPPPFKVGLKLCVCACVCVCESSPRQGEGAGLRKNFEKSFNRTCFSRLLNAKITCVFPKFKIQRFIQPSVCVCVCACVCVCVLLSLLIQNRVVV